MSKMEEGDHPSMQAIKDRGWTAALMRDFLGEPDKLVKNPHYRTGPPCKLYALGRVETAEQRADFQRRMERILARRPARRRAAKEHADRERQKLVDLVESTPIHVRRTNKLLSRAIDHYNDFRRYHPSGDLRLDFLPATRHSDPAFLRRITCNYVRHELTEYDHFLYSKVRSKIGCEEAYQRFRERVDEAVLEYVDSRIPADLSGSVPSSTHQASESEAVPRQREAEATHPRRMTMPPRDSSLIRRAPGRRSVEGLPALANASPPTVVSSPKDKPSLCNVLNTQEVLPYPLF